MKKSVFVLIFLLLVYMVSAQEVSTDTLFKGDYQNAEKVYNDGVKFFENKKYNEAIKKFSEAIALKPDFEKAYFNMANCYAQMKKYDDAIKCCDKTMELKGKLVNIVAN